MGKIITVSAFKGGVGKTTTATNIVAAIKKLKPKKKVLLVDLDFQANATMAFNYNPQNISNTIYEAIHKEVEVEEAILNHDSDIDIIPASFDLCAFDLDLFENENNKFPNNKKPYILKELLEPLKCRYDYIVCDAGPSLSMIATNYIAMSDQFIVVLQTGRFALSGAIKLIDYIHDVRRTYSIGQVYEINMVITFFDSRTNISIDVMQQARKYGDQNNIYVAETTISKTVRYENAQAYHGIPLVLSENSEYSSQYEDLTKELIFNG